MAEPWRIENGRLRLRVRLTPRAARDAIDGVGRLSDGSPVLLARVRALPEAGAANEALTRLLAEALAIRRTAVAIAAGRTGRVKEVEFHGDGAALVAILSRLPQVK